MSAVLPCRNEARNLEVVLPRLPAWLHQVVVVDSGCTDDTVEVARRLCPQATIVTAAAPGKGAALEAGFSVATGEYVVALDADGSNDPAEIAAIVSALDAGADLVKGSRYLPGGGSSDTTRLRSLGNSVLCGAFNALHRVHLTDLCYGYVGFRRPLRDGLLEGATGFDVEAVLAGNACRRGVRIDEVPSFEARRVHGDSHLHPLRDGTRILIAILRTRFRRARPVGAS